jgi:hypothetical protein
MTRDDVFIDTFQAAGTISSCMVADHLLKLGESDGDISWHKKAVKESAATALGGEHIYLSVTPRQAECDNLWNSWH